MYFAESHSQDRGGSRGLESESGLNCSVSENIIVFSLSYTWVCRPSWSASASTWTFFGCRI